jgi:hypothetical protein
MSAGAYTTILANIAHTLGTAADALEVAIATQEWAAADAARALLMGAGCLADEAAVLGGASRYKDPAEWQHHSSSVAALRELQPGNE